MDDKVKSPEEIRKVAEEYIDALLGTTTKEPISPARRDELIERVLSLVLPQAEERPLFNTANEALQAAYTTLQLAFLAGAKWWEFHSTGATMWGSDQRLTLEEAKKRFPFPKGTID